MRGVHFSYDQLIQVDNKLTIIYVEQILNKISQCLPLKRATLVKGQLELADS